MNIGVARNYPPDPPRRLLLLLPSSPNNAHPSHCSALGLLPEASGIMMTFVHFLKKDWIAFMICSMLFSETCGCTGIDNTSSQAFPVSGKALLFCDSLPL